MHGCQLYFHFLTMLAIIILTNYMSTMVTITFLNHSITALRALRTGRLVPGTEITVGIIAASVKLASFFGFQYQDIAAAERTFNPSIFVDRFGVPAFGETRAS